MKLMKNSFWNKLSKPIVGLAPMDGITDEPMRQIQVGVAKPDLIYTEFVSAEGLVREPQYFVKTLQYKKNEQPIVAQLFGNKPEMFAQALPSLVKMGFAGVDINMGCPAKNVLGQGGGGALIGDYETVEQIIKAASGYLPLSVKTRIGKSIEETQQWFEFLAGLPIQAVAIHGRKVSQKMQGVVDWEQIGSGVEIFRRKKIIYLGNGGISSVNEAREKIKKYKLDGVLIGQAALGNPWVFREDYVPTKEERLKIMLKHACLVWDYYGEKGFVKMRKHFCWYCSGFVGSKKLKVALLKTKSLSEVESLLKLT